MMDPEVALASQRRLSRFRFVDVLFPSGPDFIPIEIKAGRTIQTEWFSGFARFAAARGVDEEGGIVVHAGDDFQRRSKGWACGIWSLREALDTWPP